MKNEAERVMQQIKELTEKKAKDLETIHEAIERETQAEAAALEAVAAAATVLDLERYHTAQAELSNAREHLAMYRLREQQLAAAAYVSEEESDAVIDRLKDYEASLSAGYDTQAAKIIEELKTCTAVYIDAVAAAESAMKTWTRDVHSNHRAPNTTYPDGTNRAPYPVPVRPTPYTGDALSKKVQEFIKTL